MKQTDITSENGWVKFSDKQPEMWSKFDVWSSCNGIVLNGLVMSPFFMPRKGWTHYKTID